MKHKATGQFKSVTIKDLVSVGRQKHVSAVTIQGQR